MVLPTVTEEGVRNSRTSAFGDMISWILLHLGTTRWEVPRLSFPFLMYEQTYLFMENYYV